MGLPKGLFEGFSYRDGRIENGNLADYRIATVMDTPEIVPVIVESIHAEAPYDAIGVRIRLLPITPEKVPTARGETPASEESAST